MKKIVFAIMMIAALVTNSYSQTASLTVFSQDGEKFWVIMNGIRQNQEASTNVVVTGLGENNYRVKIIFEDDRIKSIDRNISPIGVDGLYSQTQVIRKDRKGRYIMRMSSFEEVRASNAGNQSAVTVPYSTQERPPQTQPSQEQSDLDRSREAELMRTNMDVREDGASTSVTVRDPETGEIITVGVGINVSETGFDMDMRIPGGTVTTSASTSSQTRVSTSTQIDGRMEQESVENRPPAYVMPGYNGPVGCPYPMSAGDFNQAKASIASRTFEDSKLTIAKQITASNCLLSSQIKEIMMLFSFEDTKLNFAKYAYGYTFDLGNFYKVNDAFTFEMTIDELNDYISRQRR